MIVVGGGGVAAKGAEHMSLLPPLEPMHPHVQGPDPDTTVAVPEEQRFTVGAVSVATPFADPHTPLTGPGGGGGGAVQSLGIGALVDGPGTGGGAVIAPGVGAVHACGKAASVHERSAQQPSRIVNAARATESIS